jgi:copper homeostasis protein
MLVRPRTGAFTASDAEYEVRRQDILFARAIGIDFVVLGLLHENRRVDVERTRALVELAHPLPVTFHRAFDVAPDLEEALHAVLETGALRILTSGGQPTAVQGAATVNRLRQIAGDRIGLMLCGGVTAGVARQVLESSGAREVHAALRGSVHVESETGMISETSLSEFAEAVSLLKQETGKVRPITFA